MSAEPETGLNREVASREAAGEPVVGPELPPGAGRARLFVTTDCVRAEAHTATAPQASASPQQGTPSSDVPGHS